MATKKMNIIWNIEQAQRLCSNLERLLQPVGAHVALGGSVLYNGSSEKDVDIFIYPHASTNITPLSPVLRKLTELGFTNSTEKPSVVSGGKVIRVMTGIDGRRVDFFFFDFNVSK